MTAAYNALSLQSGGIRRKNQRLIAVSIDGEQASPSVAQAKRLRELDKAGKLTGDIIDGILSEEKKEVALTIKRTAKEDVRQTIIDWAEKLDSFRYRCCYVFFRFTNGCMLLSPFCVCHKQMLCIRAIAYTELLK